MNWKRTPSTTRNCLRIQSSQPAADHCISRNLLLVLWSGNDQGWVAEVIEGHCYSVHQGLQVMLKINGHILHSTSLLLIFLYGVVKYFVVGDMQGPPSICRGHQLPWLEPGSCGELLVCCCLLLSGFETKPLEEGELMWFLYSILSMWADRLVFTVVVLHTPGKMVGICLVKK